MSAVFPVYRNYEIEHVALQRGAGNYIKAYQRHAVEFDSVRDLIIQSRMPALG